MELEWGLMIAIYLFLAGAGAGAFLFAIAAEVMGKEEELESLIKVGTLISGPLVGIGTAFLLLSKTTVLFNAPLRPLLLFLNFNPTSVISWGAWILSIFIPLALIYGFTKTEFGKGIADNISNGIINLIRFLAVITAFGTAIYTGLVLGVLKAIPFWNNSILPVLFLVSALSTGLAAAIFGGVLIDRKLAIELKTLNPLHAGLIIFELGLIFFLLLVTSNTTVEAGASVSLLLSGQYSFLFWICVIGLGLVIPLLIQVVYMLKGSKSKLKQSAEIEKSEAETAATGSASVKVEPTPEAISAKANIFLFESAIVLLGGFVLRYLILAVGVPINLF